MVWTKFKCCFFPLFQQRIKDQFIQQWKAEIENSSKLKYYNKYKTECFVAAAQDIYARRPLVAAAWDIIKRRPFVAAAWDII